MSVEENLSMKNIWFLFSCKGTLETPSCLILGADEESHPKKCHEKWKKSIISPQDNVDYFNMGTIWNFGYPPPSDLD